MSVTSGSLSGLSADELRRTIDDKQFQLSTLDFRTPNFSKVKENLRAEVQAMERLVEKEAQKFANTTMNNPEAMDGFPSNWSRSFSNVPVRDHQMHRPHTSHSTTNFGSGFGAYAQNQQNGFGGHFASDGLVLGHGQGGPEPLWGFERAYNPPDIPAPDSHFELRSTSPSTSSPEQMSSQSTRPLPTLPNLGRKRQRESHTLAPINGPHGAKSLRTTPSPAPTGTVTPASEDSFNLDEESVDFFRLIGGDPREDLRELRKNQKETEKALEVLKQKREQERADAELARAMNEEYERERRAMQSFGSSLHASEYPSASSSSSSQTILDSQGSFQRPAPPALAGPSKSPGEPRPDFMPPGARTVSYGTPNAVKVEKPRSLMNRPAMGSSNFIDLGSDDSEEASGNFGSDPVEIDPSSFRPSGRKPRPGLVEPSNQGDSDFIPLANGGLWTGLEQAPAAGWTTIDSSPNDQPTPYYDLTGYGGSSVYHPDLAQGSSSSSSWANRYDRVRQGVSAVATGVGSAVNSLMDGQINSYLGPSNHHGTNGYSANDFGAMRQDPTLLGFSPAQDVYGQARLRNLQDILNNNPFDPANPTGGYQQYMDHVNYLSADPTRSSDAIKTLLENIRPDEEMDPRTRMGTPESMSAAATLYEHQKLGLQWMVQMEQGSNKGGILADDMGLGKTIQAIALMVKNRSPDPARKTTLIVAPLALLKQWESEIAIKVKPERKHRLSTWIFHASGTKTSWEALRKFDVVLTTYGTIASEYRKKLTIETHKRNNPNWRPTSREDALPLLGDECRWFRVILDEAQGIKNKTTRSAKAVFELQALTRFCMSGTPMMNNVGELFSLIHFLRIKPYCFQDDFNADFKRPFQSSSETVKQAAMRKLQALLKAILLRRTKKSQIDGQPILTLPERTTEVQHSVFSEDEETFYRALETQTQLKFNRYLRAGTIGKNYSNVLVLLLRLRQACCHPHLIKDFGIECGIAGDVSADEMINLAKGLALDVVNRIKDAGAIECPICMDSAENATIFIPCGHSTCSECFTRIQDPTQAMADDEGAEGRIIKCPNCRGKVDPKKVTNYESFKRVHMPEAGSSENDDPIASTDTESEDSSDDSDDSSSLGGFVVADDVLEEDETESEDDGTGEEGYRKGKTPFEKSKRVVKKEKVKGKGKQKAKADKAPRKTLAQLKAESRKNAAARKKYLKRLDKDWETSGKIEKVMEILQATNDRKEGEKTIIFSQFTSLLDLLEIPIHRKDWVYRRYDGSMSAAARNDAVLDFTSKPECRIILVSLKAGNSGLNLTAASQVIITDPFWNPYIEEQAIDRAHRIGQRRPVQVHRILVPNTVEDRILAMQEKKREMIEGALDENAGASIGRLGAQELAFLF
ncbi:hypothetical protein MMC13_005131, partial [Lambiella insularis]|nr:hypothetical protein [Lambiella insularis]